jgi:hypothetical protein
MAPRRCVAGEQRCAVGLQPGEEGCVADEAVFDDLGVAGGELARRQRRQRVAVGEDEARLMEGADEVLAVPLLPPTELSTWASSVVGTWMKSMPRSSVAAAKPARSPTTPPPRATSIVPRSIPSPRMSSARLAKWAKSLLSSPGGRTTA